MLLGNRFDTGVFIGVRMLFSRGSYCMEERLGALREMGTVELETATQEKVQGVVCAPVCAQIEGFRPVSVEVLFVDTKAEDERYEPLIGYLVLEPSQAAVDMLGHRLLHVKYLDLK